jgi:hypothetical protein
LTVNITFNLALLNFVALVIISILAYVLIIRYKKRKLEQAMALIQRQILAFFGAAGMQVEVTCFSSDYSRKFTVCIDSQPVKKFKFSNLVEMVVIRYIARTTGIAIERVYWRFSLPTEKEGEMLSPIETVATEGMEFDDNYDQAETMDDAYKVAETSWDHFEKALHQKEAEKAAKKGTKKEAEIPA